MSNDEFLDQPIFKQRSNGIDCERAILAYWVLFSHLMPWAEITNTGNEMINILVKDINILFQSHGETHPAVLGFIVLSGYCIHRNGFRRNFGSIHAYLIRRFFRIWPVYFLSTLIGIGCFFIGSSINYQVTSALSGTKNITLSCIAVKFSGLSVFLPSLHRCNFQGNAPLTTALVEIWLYILYVLIVFLILHKLQDIHFWFVLICAWILGLIYTTLNPEVISWWHNGSLISFSLYWWIGAAFVGKQLHFFTSRLKVLLVIIWILLTVLLLMKFADHLFFIEIRKIVFALLFGLITVSIDNQNKSFGKLAVFLGKGGYSIYAFHAPLLILLLVLGASWWISAITITIISLIIFRIYEEPFMTLGKKIVKQYSQYK